MVIQVKANQVCEVSQASVAAVAISEPFTATLRVNLLKKGSKMTLTRNIHHNRINIAIGFAVVMVLLDCGAGGRGVGVLTVFQTLQDVKCILTFDSILSH